MSKPEQISQTDATSEKLRGFIESIERLLPEKQAVADHIKDVYAQAKGEGFHPALMRQIIKLRAMDEHERQEQEELLAIYMRAVGMSLEGPVAQAALRSVS